jgi:hypothetical protein
VEKCDKEHLDKATMVLCGSIMEGLLHDATAKHGQPPAGTDLKRLIELAQKYGVISEEAVRVCLLIKDWRNLIHPERQLRLGISPDDLPQRAKAGKSALEMLILELEKSSPYVFIEDGEFKVRNDSQDSLNDKWLSRDIELQFNGRPSLKVEGVGKDAIPNAWVIWRPDPVRRKRFFKTHVYLKSDLAPDQLMFQFHQFPPDADSWDHRVYWGRDLIRFSYGDTYPRRRMSDIPGGEHWMELIVDLKVDAELDLEKGIDGVAITLAKGLDDKVRAAWFGRSTFESRL